MMHNIEKSCTVRARVAEGLEGLIMHESGDFGQPTGTRLHWNIDASCRLRQMGLAEPSKVVRPLTTVLLVTISPTNQGNAATGIDDLVLK